jgi:transcriptional regulator with XRE-family HTH domain
MGKVDVNLVAQARQVAQRVKSAPLHGPDQTNGLLQIALGRAVRDYRRRHDLNGIDLANAAGISFGMLSRIENGTVSPSLSTLQAIGTALGVPVTDLIGRYNEQSRAVFVSSRHEGPMDEVSTALVREISSSTPLALDAFVVRLTSEQDQQQRLEERGTFYVHCLAGEVTYGHAAKRYTMAPGDSLTFEASGAHGVTKGTRFPVKLLIVRNYQAPRN